MHCCLVIFLEISHYIAILVIFLEISEYMVVIPAIVIPVISSYFSEHFQLYCYMIYFSGNICCYFSYLSRHSNLSIFLSSAFKSSWLVAKFDQFAKFLSREYYWLFLIYIEWLCTADNNLSSIPQYPRGCFGRSTF